MQYAYMQYTCMRVYFEAVFRIWTEIQPRFTWINMQAIMCKFNRQYYVKASLLKLVTSSC